jgi:7,8-dihydropterin-6-yl-methyl-4-(beta-D-ribofuranosyl)aminobenzene 5'-phosphate synthase
MSPARIGLMEADAVQVFVIMDNYIDLLLPGGARVERPALAKDGVIPSDTLLAEHGLSLLITVRRGVESTQVLLDAGYSQVGVPHNLDMLGVSLKDVEAVVLSHGHMDHFGALPEVVRRVGRPVPLVVHPEALAGKRFRKTPAGVIDRFPPLPAEELDAAGAILTWAKEPYLAPSALWAASGGVSRTTEFEKGMPGALMDTGDGMVPDPLADDMAIIINLKDKGLVVISGCAHAGIINTVRHAIQLTGQDKVHAVIGGFHLSGAAFEPIIGRTVEELKAWHPQVVMPMHCTGRKAQAALEKDLGPAFVVASVGAKLSLGASAD